MAGTSSASLTLDVGTPLWLHWMRIAKSTAKQARRAAGTAPEAPAIGALLSADDEEVGHVNHEMYPAMVAITATAFALDGMYDQVRDFAHTPFKAGVPRQRQILETLKVGFSIGKVSHAWLPRFDWLFGLRDRAAHHDHQARPTVQHPSGWGNLPAEYSDYSAGNAEKALALFEDVLSKCVDHPKPVSRQWAEGTGRWVLEELRAIG
jgi:hypothetical protein